MKEELREKLRLEMVDHDDKARELRKQIDLIDLENNKEEIERRKKLLGKCYKADNDYEFFRLDYLDKYMNFHGLRILAYSYDQCTIEVNHEIWEETVKEAKEFPTEEFYWILEKYQKLITSEIKIDV